MFVVPSYTTAQNRAQVVIITCELFIQPTGWRVTNFSTTDAPGVTISIGERCAVALGAALNAGFKLSGTTQSGITTTGGSTDITYTLLP
jgi:hypothetical protein